jgi:cobalt/nickel transport system permease protein
MTGGHGHTGVEVVAAGDSPIHRLDPRVKIVGLIGLAVVAVTTPPGAWAAYAAYLAVLGFLIAVARLPLRHVGRRATIELPFLAAAAILPFTVPDGRMQGATLALRITIGTLAMIVLSSTTPFPRLLRGFELLRAPRLLLVIVAFMWRYAHVLGEEIARMKVARDARGYRGRWLWQAGAGAAMLGTLFIRALERGERVYLAMLARGYGGGIPATVGPPLALRAADVGFAALLAAALLSVRVVLPPGGPA